MTIIVADLIDYPEALNDAVDWIDREWSSYSGRSRAETLARFSSDIERDVLPITLIAKLGGKAAGLASLRVRDSYDYVPGASPWICNVYVATEHRGAGIARRLCEALEARAIVLGFDQLFLATALPADSLYHRIGYAPLTDVVVQDQTWYVLRKAIA